MSNWRNSHFSARTGLPKLPYQTAADASLAASRATVVFERPMCPYRCVTCRLWHIGNNTAGERLPHEIVLEMGWRVHRAMNDENRREVDSVSAGSGAVAEDVSLFRWCHVFTRWRWDAEAQVWLCTACDRTQGLVERDATPDEVDNGCELGLAYDPVGGRPEDIFPGRSEAGL